MDWIIGLALLVTCVIAIQALLGSKLPAPFKGKAYVIDGDTIEVDGERIRLFGMDAPEMGQSQGLEAKKALASMTKGHTVKVYPVDIDRYHRLVGRVIRTDGKDLSELMVENGLALASTRYSKKYLRAQVNARRTKAGFWATGGIQDAAAYRRATQ
jgi:endonuclease YncB( thermonuclease family)